MICNNNLSFNWCIKIPFNNKYKTPTTELTYFTNSNTTKNAGIGPTLIPMLVLGATLGLTSGNQLKPFFPARGQKYILVHNTCTRMCSDSLRLNTHLVFLLHTFSCLNVEQTHEEYWSNFMHVTIINNGVCEIHKQWMINRLFATWWATQRYLQHNAININHTSFCTIGGYVSYLYLCPY